MIWVIVSRSATGGRWVADQLEADKLTGLRPWEQWLDLADGLFRRPPDKTDRLVSGTGSVRHPRRATSGHRPDRPKIHKGRIGSADISLRDVGLRDRLAAEHNLRALLAAALPFDELG